MNRFYRKAIFLILGLACLFSASTYADSYPARKCGPYPGLEDDPFRRCIVFKNELPFTVWPVLEAPLNANGIPGSDVAELFVNKGGVGKGLPTGQEVKLYVPKNGETDHHWYQAARIFIFTVEPNQLLKLIHDPQTTPFSDGKAPKYDPCPGEPAGSCWAGRMKSSFSNDAPAQLAEFSTISKDWSRSNEASGQPHRDDGVWDDEDNPKGAPFIDYDVSYVDHVYLPLTITLDDGGATRYTGTEMGYDAGFSASMDSFTRNSSAGWQIYAAYSSDNWGEHNLITRAGESEAQRLLRFPSGSMLIDGVLHPDLSSLFVPWAKKGTSASCKADAWPECHNLAGDCCPNGSMMLGCCGLTNYMVDGTSKVGGKAWNKSLDAIWARWNKWVNVDGNSKSPCNDINSIASWPSDKPEFDKQGFCDQFQASVKYLWGVFENSKDVQNLCSKFKSDKQSYNYCIMSYVVGYKVPKGDKEKGRQPETVQGLMRNVPWGDGSGPQQKQYHWDKFMHYWAPTDSVFNLNPYIYLVKHTKEEGGIGAKTGYSFSIDDQWANYQDLASGMIVDIGGSSALLNLDSFDPYEQFIFAVPKGWDHATVCGRPVDIKGQGMAFTFSFWQNAKHQDYCDIVAYPKSSNDSYVSFRLREVTKTVTDQFTGLAHKVKGFEVSKADADFCKNNTTPDQVLLCDPGQTKIEPRKKADDEGGLEVVYVSVAESQRPNVTITFRPPNGQ
jgi:hypothetical protein